MRRRKISDMFGEIGGAIAIVLVWGIVGPPYWVGTRFTKKFL
jgi:hypothetical protein